MLVGPILFNQFLWLLWQLWWKVGAQRSRDAHRAIRQESWPQFLTHWLLLHGGYWLMFAPAYFGERHPYGLREMAGLVMTAIGLLFAVAARHRLGREWSGAVTVFEQHMLVTRGPYEFVRHPIYSGLLFAAAGSALAIGTWTADFGLSAMLAGFTVKLRREEEYMAEAFGTIYAIYRVGTWRLMPYVF